MVNDYADGKIQDALKHAGGSQTQARKTLLEWALKDQMLLISLTQQHLGSIVAHAISKASAGNDGGPVQRGLFAGVRQAGSRRRTVP